MAKNNNVVRNEFYLGITPEQLARAGEDYFIGTRLDTGKEIKVRLFTEAEIKEYGLNPINRGTYRRPEINQMLSGEGTGSKPFKTIKKFQTLSSEQFKNMPNVVCPSRLVLRVDTAFELPDGTVGSRWITVLNGEGSEMLQMDNDKFIVCSGLDGNGLYMQIVRPNINKFQKNVVPNLFVEALNVAAGMNSGPDTFRNDLIAAMGQNMKMKSAGGSPLLHVVIYKNGKAARFNFSYTKNGKTKEYQGSDFIIRASAQGPNGEWTDFAEPADAIDAALASENGVKVVNYLNNNRDAMVAIVPGGSFMVGPNVRNKIISDLENEKMTDRRFAPFEIDFGGEYPIKAYNRGQFTVRQGTQNKDAWYVTDICTTDVFAAPVSLQEVTKYILGIGGRPDSAKRNVPEIKTGQGGQGKGIPYAQMG